MLDPILFAAGALFTQDYLSEGIARTAAYAAVDAEKLRARLEAILAGFPYASRPNEATSRAILESISWRPKHADLEHIVRDAFRWEMRLSTTSGFRLERDAI